VRKINRNINALPIFLPVVLCLCVAVIGSCGKTTAARPHQDPLPTVEAKFRAAAVLAKLPVRMLIAAAWLESRMTPDLASSLYLNSESGSYDAKKGILLAQSAFGIPLETLGLTGREDSGEMAVQIEAYAPWLAKIISESAVLNANPLTPDEKFDWIVQMAEAHRPGSEFSRNVRTIFAKELLKILNDGFTWQDPKNGEILRFPKEIPELKASGLREDSQRRFNLTTGRPEIESATFLKLGRTDLGSPENHPTAIEVVHCPLTLSACLQLQHQEGDDEVRLETHYLIPQDDLIITDPVQVTRHENTVRLTDTKGITNYLANTIVIMLVGNSGRLVEGYRNPANPGWMTKWQLQRLGDVINDVCLNLHETNQVDTAACLASVNYHYQGVSEAFRWGDIADFDPLIFSGYISNPGGLQGEAAFKFPGDIHEFVAGSPIPLTVVFGPSVKHIELEQLVRCADQKVVWAPIAAEDVRSQTSFSVAKKLFDAGPNLNGNQFFRTKVYSADGTLIGWDTSEIFLKNFEKNSNGMTPKTCATQSI
jgi:hypothetical protein